MVIFTLIYSENWRFRNFQLIPSPGEARGWGVVEALSYGKRGLGELRSAGHALQKESP